MTYDCRQRPRPERRTALRDGRVRNERGATTVFVVGFVTGAMSFFALIVNVGMAFQMRGQLQGVADAAALAGAAKLPDTAQTRAEVQAYAALNAPGWGTVVRNSDIAFGTWDDSTNVFTVTTVSPNAVRVTARRSEVNDNALPLIFGSLVGKSGLNIGATAIAKAGNGKLACIYQLRSSSGSAGENALQISNNTTVRGCGTRVNSRHSTRALAVENSSSINSTGFTIEVQSGGGWTGGASITPTPVSKPLFADPLEGLARPTGSCSSHSLTQISSGNTTIANTTGTKVYCGGLKISGSSTRVNLEPGTYVMAGGGLTVENGARLDGTGVTIYLTCNSFDCTSNGGTYKEFLFSDGMVNLTAPSTGTLRGIVIFQDYVGTNTTTIMDKLHHFAGGVMLHMDGVIYLKYGMLYIDNGTQVVGGAKLSIVVDRARIYSGTNINFNEPTNPPIAMGEGPPTLVK